jgi:hypothetical protein
MDNFNFHQALQNGLAIPAHPLALNAQRKLDERRQRALARYYIAAGAGGLAVGVHTTQFAIRAAKIGLFEPVLALAAEEMSRAPRPLVRIAGVCGETKQAVAEAAAAYRFGYHAALLSLGALHGASEDALIEHCRVVAEVLPIVGFYLQSSVGGRALPYAFWRRFAEIEKVVAIKIAPFNRYQTQEVVRAVIEAGRDDIALYTGNDDNIVADLLTPFRFAGKERRIVGGLLGHWSVWTKRASKSRTATRPSSMRRTASAAASPACTKCCAVRACSKAPGSSMNARRSARARATRSSACIAPTRISTTMTSSHGIAMNG